MFTDLISLFNIMEVAHSGAESGHRSRVRGQGQGRTQGWGEAGQNLLGS